MRLSTLLLTSVPLLARCTLLIVENETFLDQPIQHHEDQLHPLHPRDSVTIKISSSFTNTTVSNIQNNVKFEVINNAKNANIAQGDESNFTSHFRTFGDKNMIDSKGSATGEHVSINDTAEDNQSGRLKRMFKRMTGSSSKPVPIRNDIAGLFERSMNMHRKRSTIHLNILGGDIKSSNLIRSGNGNVVEVYIAEGSQDDVNITIKWIADGSNTEDSVNENRVKVFTGHGAKSDRVETANATIELTETLRM